MSKPTKEQVLEELKNFVHKLIDTPDIRDAGDLGEQSSKLKIMLSTVDSCDCNWLNDEYGKWIKSDPKVQEAINQRKGLFDKFGIDIS